MPLRWSRWERGLRPDPDRSAADRPCVGDGRITDREADVAVAGADEEQRLPARAGERPWPGRTDCEGRLRTPVMDGHALGVGDGAGRRRLIARRWVLTAVVDALVVGGRAPRAG